LRIALQVTRALRVAHKAGVVHRDLKPANIMLLNHDDDTRDFVKVVDFGLAKLFQDKSDGGIDLTKAGTMLGSPRYMAPEQIRNDEVDPRTDIYSLGVIIFFMLTGRPPFMGNNATEILAQHLRDPVPNMAAVAGELEVPHELEQVVRRCLAKDPAGRYPTVDELVADLKAVQRSTSDRTLASDSFMEVVRPTSRLTEDLVVPFPDADVDVEVEPAQGQELPSNTAPVQHD
ncbi:MAG: serine/threonine protein kinase, partial [Myxococcales bacterium]|nr:serine/threonine protein kinase [Myxococcales bacterium]